VQGESSAAAATLRCRETVAEQQTVLHQRDTARLQRMESTCTAGRPSAPALLKFMQNICHSRSVMATALQVSVLQDSCSILLTTICGAAASMC